jgi:MYXO-CTERM domain-containing protein
MAHLSLCRSFCRTFCRIWTAALAASLTAVAAAPPAHAQTVTWTQTQISPANGAMPSIEVDRLGYVHVGWTLGLGGSSYSAYHATNTSGDYRTTLVDSKSSGGPTPYFPYLTTDSLGFFHMVWRDLGLTGSKPLLYRTNNPETRALVKMSFSSTGHTHDPLVEVTPDDIAHVVTEGDSCTGCPSGSNLYDESFITSSAYAGRVTSLAQDANDATGVQQFSSATTMDGTRHLVFSMRLAPPADNQRLIYYTSRAAGGTTWSTPVSITGHQDNYQGWPAIVVDQANTLHGIYFVKRVNGGAWSTPLRINDQNTVADAIPSIAIDPNGRLHVVFQRYTGSTVALYYTTNAYETNESDWLDPASRVLNNVGTFTLTHQNRKVAVNWVDGQVLVPYLSGTTMWLASTTDVPVTPLGPNGTSTTLAEPGFVAPTTLNRTTSNSAATATTVMRFTIVDGGGDSAPTRIRALHFHAGGAQSFTPVSGKDEVLSYLLGGAQIVTESGQVLPALISDTKLVVRDVDNALQVPPGGARDFELQVWMKNVAQVVNKTVDLRLKPDQDVVVDPAGSRIAVDQPVIETEGMLIVDNNAQCPTGTACNDGNPCTHSDMCNNANVCVGLTVTCNSDPCNARTCNGTATCTVTPVACGGSGGASGTGGASGSGGAPGTGGNGTGGMISASGGTPGAGSGGMVSASGGSTGSGSGGATMNTGGGSTGGVAATGGASAASGGATGATGTGGAPMTGADAAAADAGTNQPKDSGGCGCSVAFDSHGGNAGAALVFSIATLLVRRRRR